MLILHGFYNVNAAFKLEFQLVLAVNFYDIDYLTHHIPIQTVFACIDK